MPYNPGWVFDNVAIILYCCLSSKASSILPTSIVLRSLAILIFRRKHGRVDGIFLTSASFHTSLAVLGNCLLQLPGFFSTIILGFPVGSSSSLLEWILYRHVVVSTTMPYILLSIVISKTRRPSSFATVGVQTSQPNITIGLNSVL